MHEIYIAGSAGVVTTDKFKLECERLDEYVVQVNKRTE